uniref:Histone deacetylase n=1 Tax=Oryza punctata TaxID=4537 RepID=A0A0E0L325_ORYPU
MELKYIEELVQANAIGAKKLCEGTFLNPGSWGAALLAAGTTLSAMKHILDGHAKIAYALVRPPGHHAQPDRADGYCFLNNAGLAVKLALDSGRRKVAVVDIDVHYGNGTAEGFYHTDSVLTISLHMKHGSWGPSHPQSGSVDEIGEGRGLGYNLNIPLPNGSGDAGYEYAMNELVVPAIEKFQPELLVFVVGQDSSAFDPNGRQCLTMDGYRKIGQIMRGMADQYSNGRGLSHQLFSILSTRNTRRIGKETLKAGDHIYSWRAAWVYAHHGIYVGDDKVIHFTRGRGQEVGTGTFIDLLLVSSGPNTNTPCSICNNEGATTNTETNGVVSSCLNCFLAGGALYRFEYAVNPALFLAKARGGTCTLAPTDPDEVVVRRANHLLSNGFRCYNLFKSNCEDFAIYCKTGLLVAEQGVVGQSGQAISIIGGPLAAVISTPFRLVTTNIYGMAVMAVGVYCASRYAADIGNRRDVLKVEVEDLTAGLASGRIRALENISQLVAPAEAQGLAVAAPVAA